MEQGNMETSSQALTHHPAESTALNTYHNMNTSIPQQQQHIDLDLEAQQKGDCWWHFTDFGHVRELSRDGSIHATDEVFNSVSHLSAFLVSVLASALLISQASAMGHPWKIVSFSIYGASLCFLFSASTLHHAITTTPEWERFFQLLDYLAIFPLISGTFTPLCLVFFPYSTIGWTFCGCVWILSFGSMAILIQWFDKVPKWCTMTMYITLGWFGVFLGYWLYPIMGVGGIALLVGGGVLYTVGGIIYSTEYPNPVPGKFGFHELWHLFVIFGAAVHWFMMYGYVLYWERPE